MVSETVLVEIDADSPLDNGFGKVTATFTMRNLGNVDEQMNVRFPLDQTIGWSNLCRAPSFINPTIDDLRVKVNGNAVSTQTTYQTVPVMIGEEPWPTTTIPCWAKFPVFFPVGKDVIIEVSYTAEPYDFAGYRYSYVLITGSGWKDTIGSADIIFQVPYELNDSNFISCFPQDCKISTNIVRWHYENFEPSSNVTVSLSSPPLWQSILLETQNTTRNPNDGEAWGRLAKAYKESIREKRGYRSDAAGQEMYQLSKNAYQNAVTLLPNDPDWHYGFADLLCWNAGYNNYLVDSETEAWIECTEQVQQVLNLNPNHEKTRELIQFYGEFDGMIDFSGSQPDYIILTPKPTTTSTPSEKPVQVIATSTAIPSSTAQITKTAGVTTTLAITSTPIPVQVPEESNTPIYIGGFILLCIIAFMVVRFRKT
jgi:tetratricopeptide (TPR) repeat protein